jgi:hypothetical protein
MAVHVEFMGSAGGGPVFPPKGTQNPFWWGYQGTTLETRGDHASDPSLNLMYIGSDSLNTRLAVIPEDTFATRYTVEFGTGPPDVGYFQTGVITFPWSQAWYTQTRRLHTAVDTLSTLNGFSPNIGGLAAYSVLCCFSGNTGFFGSCYAFTAAMFGTAPDADTWTTHIQRWQFGDSARFSDAPPTDGAEALTFTNLLNTGLIGPDTRMFFQAIPIGSNTWRLVAMTVEHPDITPWEYQIRGVVDDNVCGPGMGAFAALQFGNTPYIQTRGAGVTGSGLGDPPWVSPTISQKRFYEIEYPLSIMDRKK